MEKDLDRVYSKIESIDPYKIVISNPRKQIEYKKILFIKKLISNKEVYQIEKYTDKQVFHENIPLDQFNTRLNALFDNQYKQINAYGVHSELEIKFNKALEGHIIEKTKTESKDNTSNNTNNGVSASKMVYQSNNRKKNYILEEGMDIPVFVKLGIFTKELKVSAPMYDKYKQINRFIEFVDDAVKNFNKDEINIIDFGCGKSYLTFIIYHYLTKIKGIKANIVGLDLKKDVISKCNNLAREFGYDGLRFEIGDINGYKADFDVDMVVTLHACDTATDYALYNAISWNASMILSVPCCQHELNKQIKSESLSAITKYGIVKERVSALITDAIRGCMLEYAGYKTDLIEFIDIEHSPKNILIRANKRNLSKDKRDRALQEAKNICEEFNVDQTLMKLLLSYH